MRPGQAESTEAYDRPWKRVSTAALSLGAEEEQPTARVPGAGGCKGLILLRPLNAGRRLFPRKATCGWFWYFCHQKYRSRDDVAGIFQYLFPQKVPKAFPADASAYFVPANVRNGRLFAGLQANRPRFLPLLAGPSFHGSGIGPESFAAKRGGKDASGTSRKHRSLRSPPRGGLGRTKRQQKTRRLPGCKQPAPLKPRRSSGRSQGLGRTKRLKGPAVAGLRRSLPPKDSDTPRARTAECFMYSR